MTASPAVVAGFDDRNNEDAFGAFLVELRRHFVLTPADYLRIQRGAILLASRGISLDDGPAAAAWLAPIVSRSPAEQRLFYDLFGTPPTTEDPHLNDGDAGSQQVADGPSAPPRRGFRWRRAVLLGLVAATAAVLLAIFIPSGPVVSNNESGNAAIPAQQQEVGRQPRAEAPAEQAEPPSSEYFVWRYAFPVLALLLANLARLHWLRRRERNSSPDTSAADEAIMEAALPSLFDSPAFRHDLGMLRRHQPVESRKLHIGRSVRATVRAGGRPMLQFGMRPMTPDYVLLADRHSPRDLLPLIGDVLRQRMAEERISAAHYEYYIDARRLSRLWPVRDHQSTSLADLSAKHAKSRLMLLAERHDCLDQDGDAKSWLRDLALFESPVLLNAGPISDRAASMKITGDLDLLVVPATPEGLLAYSGRVCGRNEHLPRVPAESDADFIGRLSREKHLVLDEEAPDTLEIDAMLIDLARALGSDAMRLLRMVAVLPVVEPAFTLLLTTRIAAPEGNALEKLLLSVARLPWMRTGYMPLWLRRALVRGLAPEDLNAAAEASCVYLAGSDLLQRPVHDPSPPLRLRRRIAASIAMRRGSEFRDDILIGALRGASSDELARAPELRGLREKWHAPDRHLILLVLHTAALLLISAAAFGAFLWSDNEPPAKVQLPGAGGENETAGGNFVEPEPAPRGPRSAGNEAAEALGNVIVPTAGGGKSPADNPRPPVQPNPDAELSRPLPPRPRNSELWGSVYFDWDGTAITPQAANILGGIARRFAGEDEDAPAILIRAFIDRSEPPGYGERRAESIREFLVREGVAAELISIEPYGEDRSAVPTKDGIREPLNRLAQIYVVRGWGIDSMREEEAAERRARRGKRPPNSGAR